MAPGPQTFTALNHLTHLFIPITYQTNLEPSLTPKELGHLLTSYIRNNIPAGAGS